jgi:hypothetical protein
MDSRGVITRRAGRVSKDNRAKTIVGEKLLMTVCIFWPYTQIFLAIASGATPIGSTGCAPDDTGKRWKRKIKTIIDYLCRWIIFDYDVNKMTSITPIGSYSWIIEREKQLECFIYFNSQTRRAKEVDNILGLSHRDKAWMSWLKQIMKVRP